MAIYNNAIVFKLACIYIYMIHKELSMSISVTKFILGIVRLIEVGKVLFAVVH